MKTSVKTAFQLYTLALFLCLPVFSISQDKQLYGGIDSTKNVKWRVQPSSFDKTLRIETELIRSDYIVILNCDGSFWNNIVIETPSRCQENYMKNVNKISLDSLSNEFRNCISNYFLTNSNKHIIDTIYIENESVFSKGKIPGLTYEEITFFTTKFELYDQDSSYHSISCFYTLSELKGLCISKNFRRKSIETWEQGKKHGKWKYFDPSGKLTRLIEYEFGNIIQDITY